MLTTNGARAVAICGALALAIGGREVRADDAAKGPAPVSVLHYAPLYGSVPQSLADKATEQISTELAASNSGADFKIVEVAGAKPGGEEAAKAEPNDAAKKKIQAAIELLQKGEKLADGHKYKPAAESLEKGIAQFLASFEGADDFKALSDAYVQLALSHQKLGNDDKASKAVGDLIRLDPDRVLAAPEVPRELAHLHNKLRSDILGASRGAIRVDSTPEGAKVTIDGRDFGETPILAQAAIPGDHFVRVVKDGVGTAHEKTTVSDGTEKLSFTLNEEEATGPLGAVSHTLRNNSVDDELLKNVAKIGEQSKADYVVFGGVRKNPASEKLELKSYALRVKDGTITQLQDVSMDEGMLGANVDVLPLVTDLVQKVQEQTFAAAPGTLTLFEGVKPQKNGGGTATVVTLAPASAEAAAPDAAGGAEAMPKHRRGPVTSHEEEPTPAPAPAPKAATPPPAAAQPSDTGEGTSVLDQLRARREKAREEAKAPKKPVKQEEEATDEDQPDQQEDTGPKVDLAPQNKHTNLSELSPEDLERLKLANDAAKKKDDNTLAIALGTTGGVVGAAAIAVVLYFVLRPTAATTATAHVSWSP
jgi:tetratricopeptide (TPR) repeat protein